MEVASQASLGGRGHCTRRNTLSAWEPTAAPASTIEQQRNPPAIRRPAGSQPLLVVNNEGEVGWLANSRFGRLRASLPASRAARARTADRRKSERNAAMAARPRPRRAAISYRWARWSLAWRSLRRAYSRKRSHQPIRHFRK